MNQRELEVWQYFRQEGWKDRVGYRDGWIPRKKDKNTTDTKKDKKTERQRYRKIDKQTDKEVNRYEDRQLEDKRTRGLTNVRTDRLKIKAQSRVLLVEHPKSPPILFDVFFCECGGVGTCFYAWLS